MLANPQPIAIETSDMDWCVVISSLGDAYSHYIKPGLPRRFLTLSESVFFCTVTSVVRYAPGSKFHKHPHPEGEEFIVLSGIFSDHSGDYGPGTYCL
eukprot:1161853-Amorphochlora_amoeboformis.AAC.4